ncbi:tRNA isopentenyltransferase [Ascodesmis nigricans]|uniref:tRNA dimethylallyltransferase n=1 Tax=Ascodesmis nigricans TaxID=341454 RepID=A0A4S2N6T1_9PEZI|nr:tRNA isopentenyltransferase [Ascodesmis nigricans]
MSPPPLISVIGATGTGKSQLAVELALAFNGEIINADAMQMYRGLPIITNKITEEEMKGVPHHLLGFLDTKDAWKVNQFVVEAEQKIKEIRSRNKLPIIVGGTTYYVQSLLFPHSLSSVPESDSQPIINDKELSTRYPILDSDPETLYATLQQVDPLMASRWHPNDHRKIRRSLTIYYTTGRRASDIYADQAASAASSTALTASPYNNLIFWVHTATEPLRQRLDARVDKMLVNGMRSEIVEMKSVYDAAVNNGEKLDVEHGIWQSIGFKEFLKWDCYSTTDEGSPNTETEIGTQQNENEQQALREMKTATRQYAKTQIRWIRTKFWRLLKQPEDGSEKRLFVVDSADAKRYEENVVRPAVDITKRFLASKDLPDPETLSPLAKEALTFSTDVDISKRRDLWGVRKCDVCDVVTTNQVEWEKHVANNRHKKRVQGKKKMEEVREFLRKRELELERKRSEAETAIDVVVPPEVVENERRV